MRAVLRAARRLRDARDPLGREARAALPAATGLSSAGVALALEEHLETSATPAELASLLATVTPAPRVHVVLSSNVFVGAVRALCLGLAAAPRVSLRPSRREPRMASLLLRAMGRGAGDVAVAGELRPEPGEQVHAYGRGETLEALAASLPRGVLFWGHGAGLGVAAIGAGQASEELADALARDASIFDQRGCLSPKIVLFEGSGREASEFAGRLFARLEAWGLRAPPGPTSAAELPARRAYLDTMRTVGEVHASGLAAVALDPSPQALVLPSGARVLHLARVDDAATAAALVAPLAPRVACLGGEGAFADALSIAAPRARRAALGWMQRPALDGPVDRRSRLWCL